MSPHIERKPVSKDLIPLGEAKELPTRGLTLKTCEKWGYTVGKLSGEPVQIANFRDPITGQVIAQRVRTKDKQFPTFGDIKAAGLYGRHLWRDAGRRVIITEGEIDVPR